MYREEYPRPQFIREGFYNLNGKWQFETDNGLSGESRRLFEKDKKLSGVIEVPFCPESKLSGINEKGFMRSVWYKREFNLKDLKKGQLVFLHFGAVDYIATVYINGKEILTHKGGYSSFKCDITDCLINGDNQITVHATDDTLSPYIPSGKQSLSYESKGCTYSRTTGIWQTVWLEFAPEKRIESFKIIPSTDNCSAYFSLDLIGEGDLGIKVFYKGKLMGEAKFNGVSSNLRAEIPLKEKHLWDIGEGKLYDVEFSFGEDRVKSYFGLRKIEYKDNKFFLNGRPVFQRLVLDQGFFPDGIYTAPSDEELSGDVKRAMALGFNGARFHQKVVEERLLYHCDRLGYLVWGEFPDWGIDVSLGEIIYSVLPEWIEVLKRDFNHPSIIGWCPLNETPLMLGHFSFAKDVNRQTTKVYSDFINTVYKTTLAIDDTRPVIDVSGFTHAVKDMPIYDFHNYNQDPVGFAKDVERLIETGKFDESNLLFGYDKKQLLFASEYGGTSWNTDKKGWGYGNAPKTEEEFLNRLKGLTDVLLDNKKVFAFCYTQLTDVEQEQNGLYTFDRKPKFPVEKIKEIISKKASIEE